VKWLVNIPEDYRYRVACLVKDLKVALEVVLGKVSRKDARTHISDLEWNEPHGVHPRYLLAGYWDHQRLESVAIHLENVGRYRVDVEKEGSYDGLVTTCDAFVVTPEGEKVILEFKTVGSDVWRRVITKGPLEHHVGRLRVYLESHDADYGILLYEFRDTLEWFPVLVQRDRGAAEAYIRRLRDAQMGTGGEGDEKSLRSEEGSEDST
jgi:hypothetical protein